jgi:hypothetical protein
MDKVIRDGKVAVLVSPGYGAGWYSWNDEHDILIFHPKLVEMVEQGRNKEIDKDWVEENLGIKNVYCGGACSLEIHWLPEGTQFLIDEYDGFESLTTNESLTLIA